MNGLELSGYLVSNLMGNDGTSEEGGVNTPLTAGDV